MDAIHPEMLPLIEHGLAEIEASHGVRILFGGSWRLAACSQRLAAQTGLCALPYANEFARAASCSLQTASGEATANC